jgi:hypothetical protein
MNNNNSITYAELMNVLKIARGTLYKEINVLKNKTPNFTFVGVKLGVCFATN